MKMATELSGVATLLRTQGQLGDSALAELKSRFRGDVLRPGDPGYEAARQIWNAMIDRRPAAIARCTGTADVQEAVSFARRHQLLISVRGGGHNIAGNAVCDGGLMIDLSSMRGVHVDPARRTARAQPGLRWGDYDHETEACNLASPGGIASTTGIAGFTLGGGFGYLTRLQGFASDQLISAEVVAADGERLTASATENPDLFWGIRGGGGNFGIVTSFEFGLRPLGNVYGGQAFYRLEHAAEVMRFCQRYLAEAPDEVFLILNLRRALPSPMLPRALHGEIVFRLIACVFADSELGERLLRPIRQFRAPEVDAIGPKRYTQVQSMLDVGVPFGFRDYWKSHYLGGLPDAAIDLAVEHARRIVALRTQVLFSYLTARQPRAFPDSALSHRDAPWNFNINAMWENPEEDEDHIRWAKEFSAAMEPYSTGGVYVNFLGNEGEARVRAAYDPGKYERLVALKDRYDPTNFFRLNQNIKPSSS
jgi:FAD/FMN-containing dehydrogenase